MFRARDMHSGSSPWVPEGAKHEQDLEEMLLAIQKQWPCAELINRVGLVLYQSSKAVQRTSAFCVGPETRFGNHGTLGSSMSKSLNFTDNGLHLLGTMHDAHTRLAWEHALAFYNGLSQSGLQLNLSFNDLVSAITYSNGNDQSNAVTPYPIEPTNVLQMDQVRLFRQYYKHLLLQCRRYHLNLTKSHYLHRMKALTDKVESSMTSFSLAEYTPIHSAVLEIDNSLGEEGEDGEDESHLTTKDPVLISKVFERRYSPHRREVSEVDYLICLILADFFKGLLAY